MLQFIFCVMLAVCLWAAPAARALPSFSSSEVAVSSNEPTKAPVDQEMLSRGSVSTAASYKAEAGKVPSDQALPSYSASSAAEPNKTEAGKAPAVSQPGGIGEATLSADVERTAVLQEGRVARIFYYQGQQNEPIGIQVTAVGFIPEVFVADPAGAGVALDTRRDGDRTLKARAVLAGPGLYTVGVRSVNASKSLFNIILNSPPEVDTSFDQAPK